MNKDIEIAKSLLRAGAKVDDELQPLHCAILQGNPEIVKLLLLFGADPTIKNRCGKDAFDFLKPDQENIRELLNNVKKCPPIDKNIPRIELFKPPVTTLSDLLDRLPPPRKKQESLTSIKQL